MKRSRPEYGDDPLSLSKNSIDFGSPLTRWWTGSDAGDFGCMEKACRSVTIISQLLVNKTTEAGVRRHKTRLLESFRVSPRSS